MRRLLTASLGLLFWSALHAAPASSAPRVALDDSGPRTRVWVETAGPDGTRRTLLRETEASVRAVRSGANPSGDAAFARWLERDEPWFSYSRDGGASWSPARPLRDTLRLHDGEVRPGEPMPRPERGLESAGEAGLYLVQYRTIVLPEWRRAVEVHGAQPRSFFPDNAQIVRAPAAALPALRALEFVERVEPFHPAYRLEPALRRWLIDPAGDPGERIAVNLVTFGWGDAGKRDVARAAGRLGAEFIRYAPSGRLLELRVTRPVLRTLAAHDDVLWIDRWGEPENDMDLVREDAGANAVETTDGRCGQGVRGEVLDDGIQDDHPDFDGVLFHGSYDLKDHGTSTYGIVFGNGDRDGDGDPQATGMLPCAEQGIFADYELVFDRFAHTQELLSAPYFAVFQTNSWGSPLTALYNSRSLQMDDIIWRLDITITQSQSNNGDQLSRPQAWAKNIISVGGVRHLDTLDDSDDGWSGGASTGPAYDGRIKPDVSYWNDNIYTAAFGGGYTATFNGTSAAPPQVAGALGLLFQMWSDNVWGTDPQGATVFERRPHAATIKALLINSARQYPFSGPADDLTRMHQGWGRPDVVAARDRAATNLIVDQEVNLRLGEAIGYDVDVGAGEAELKVTMVYPDPPGITAATLHRINDVDLKVVSPSGTVYHGNVGLDLGTHSAPGGSPNGVDTVENVFVLSPEAGTWRVEVDAREVNEDAVLSTPGEDVTFALVVTGATGTTCSPPDADFSSDPDPARVGQSIRFTPSASGGAGAPFAYRWDFDDDGVADSNDEISEHVYVRPYTGSTRLRVRDADDCPRFVLHPMNVTGPDLRYDSDFGLTEVDGNGNGAVDPGEVWELRVNLRNDGNETAIGVSADLAVDPASAAFGTVTMLQPHSSFPDIAVASVGGSNDAFRFKVGSDFVCGNDAVFALREIRSADPDNRYPDEPAVVRVLVGGEGPPLEFYSDSFEFNRGWAPDDPAGEWELAAPQGLGGQDSLPGQTPKPDPPGAFDGTIALGNDLSGLGTRPGDYETGFISNFSSPPIDAGGAKNVELRFFRWLNTEENDITTVDVSEDGVTWVNVFTDPGDHTEQAWTEVAYDVSAVADGRSGFRIRFGLASDFFGVQGGWTVDLLRLFGVTKDSCDPFTQTLPGEAVGLIVGKSASGELELSWTGDCGGGSRFGVYRGDLFAGYGSLAPEPGRCDVSGTAVTVPMGAGDGDFFLVVPANETFEGSYGAGSTGPRPPAVGACRPQGDVSPCAP